MLEDILKEEVAGAKRLIAIDFHTGLGAHGEGEMISEDLPASAPYRRAKAIWGARVKSSEAGESVSAPLSGTIDKAFGAWMKDRELTFAALEVGTVPMRETFLALRKDNWLHNIAGADHPSADAIRQEIRAAFHSDTDAWKRKVWGAGEEAVAAALAALG